MSRDDAVSARTHPTRRPMITLGINAAFHDSAAAIVVDGELIAAAEEERFSRIKHAKRPVPFSAWELPYAAIDFCLAEAGIGLREVDHVAYSAWRADRLHAARRDRSALLHAARRTGDRPLHPRERVASRGTPIAR